MKRNSGSNGMHIERLVPEKPYVANPVKPVVETLMSQHLCGHEWKKYTAGTALSLFHSLCSQSGIPETERHYLLLDRELRRCISIEDFLGIIEETLF